MPPVTRSGHARLKAALVLRDALAAELGVDLALAMAALRHVEEALGAPSGLAEGKYLEALGSVSRADPAWLAGLDGEVRQACDRVRFAPRYAQYLALLLFAQWAEARHGDAEAFLARLNAFLAAHKPKGETIAPFEDADLQLAAFWMATAAGKTHVLHACLALLDRRHAWDRVLLITPSEALTNTPYASLSRHDKFNLNGETGGQLPPGEADFRRGRILFQRQDSSCSHYSPNNPDRPNNPGGHYISAILDLLTTDSRIDRLMARIACLYDPQARFVPADEIDFDLALRYMESPRAETEFVADVLRDYLRPSVSGEVGHLARERRRGQLLHYSHEGVLGFGAEKAYAIRDLPNPCEELWRRKGATSLQD